MADKSAADLSGIERAAILLMSLGEQDAVALLKHMDAREVQVLGTAMAALKDVPRDRIGQVLQNFVTTVEGKSAVGIGAHDYVRKVLTTSLGKQRGDLMIDRILAGPGPGTGIENLKWMDPKAVAQLIAEEHPQVIAIVLAQLDGPQAGAVVALLPEKLRPEVLIRIAALEELPQTAITELDQIVERRTATPPPATRRVGGARTVADIMNGMEREAGAAVLVQIEQSDADLHQRIKDLMFVFDNLLAVDDRGIQTILREVSSESLATALRGADPTVQEKIFKNMSKRAAEILRDDMEARGPVKLSEVEAAQKEIVGIAQKLAEEGTIVLGAGSGEYV